MALHFLKDDVCWTFHEAKPTVYEPTPQRLVEWDGELALRYEANLALVLGELSLPNTIGNRSQLLMLAVVSTGDEGSLTQVRRAGRYLAHVRQLVL